MKTLVSLLVSSALLSTFAFGTPTPKTPAAQNNQEVINDAKLQVTIPTSASSDTIKPKEVVSTNTDSKTPTTSTASDAQSTNVAFNNATIRVAKNNKNKTAELSFDVQNTSGKDITVTNISSDAVESVEMRTGKKVVNEVVVHDKATACFKRGGKHTASMKLKDELKNEEKINIVITTKELGEQVVSANVVVGK